MDSLNLEGLDTEDNVCNIQPFALLGQQVEGVSCLQRHHDVLGAVVAEAVEVVDVTVGAHLAVGQGLAVLLDVDVVGLVRVDHHLHAGADHVGAAGAGLEDPRPWVQLGTHHVGDAGEEDLVVGDRLVGRVGVPDVLGGAEHRLLVSLFPQVIQAACLVSWLQLYLFHDLLTHHFILKLPKVGFIIKSLHSQQAREVTVALVSHKLRIMING